MEGVDLAQRRLVVAANRGPVSFHDDPSGEPVVTRGPGGLVTVLTEVLRHHPGTWVAAALGDEERRLAAAKRAVEVALDGDAYRLRYVALDPDAYNKYYNIVANPMLWFIQHYLWDLGRHPDIGAHEMDAWHNGYLVVNAEFAKAIVDEVRRGPDGRRRRGAAGGGGDALVLLHDYHLYCVAPDVRAACPGTFLHQFIHIPWPQSDYWRVLPGHIREAVFRGLLGNDVVAFHTRSYALNFLRCCEDLLELDIDAERGVVHYEGREVWARAYPVSIDPDSLRAAAASRRARTPSASCAAGGASSSCCASTGSTSARTSSAASSRSTASSICIRSSRSASPSSPCSRRRARTSRSTSRTASGWSAWSPT